MSTTHSVTIQWKGVGGSPISKTIPVTGLGEMNFSPAVPAATVDQLVPFACPIASLQLFYVVSDQDVQMNVNAVHSGAPILTKNLKANKPFYWFVNGNDVIPFSADITALYFSNAGTQTANI